MLKLTKAELIRTLQERNAIIQALRLDLSIAKLSHLAAVRHIPKQPWQRPAHMEAARQRAMASGQVVKL